MIKSSETEVREEKKRSWKTSSLKLKELTIYWKECITLKNKGWLDMKKCESCGNDKGVPRNDNGLPCGVHCGECFEKMLRECRSRSW